MALWEVETKKECVTKQATLWFNISLCELKGETFHMGSGINI